MVIKYETQSDQVAAEIEKGIRSGFFPASSRLPSIRELADLFHVSTQVVKSAFKLLTERGLLISRSRIGVFVNVDGVLPGAKRLFVLQGQGGSYDSNYFARLLCFSNKNLYENIHIQQRSYPMGPLAEAALKYELHQIEMEHPDCLLLSTLPADEIKEIGGFPFPVIFIGEFHEGELPGFKRDQIHEKTDERGAAYLEAVHKLGCRDVCMFGGPPEIHYIKRLLAGAGVTARKYGISLRYSECTLLKTAIGLDEIINGWTTIFETAFRKRIPEAMIMDGFSHLDHIEIALKRLNLTPGKDLLLLNDIDIHPGTIHIRSDYCDFAEEAVGIIRRSMDEPGYHCGVVEIAGKIKRFPVRMEPC